MVKNKDRKSKGSSNNKSKRRSINRNDSSHSDRIEKSQQLLRSTLKPRARGNRSLDKRKALELVCGKQNMPPLSDLEKLYEESDEEMNESPSAVIKAPEEASSSSSKAILSPTICKKYADELLKIIDGHEAPPPIIPMKKYKKSDVPYIVNCTERPRVTESKNCNVFKGDDYGITSKTNGFNVEEVFLDTPGFSCNGYKFSKSIFNAQANEIASKLLVNDYNPITSSDSDDTVVSEINSPKNRFSPQPSTSKDSETILKNDQKFNESFIALNKSYDDINNRIEQVGKTIDKGLFNVDVEMNDNKKQANSKPKTQENELAEDLLTNNATSLNSNIHYDDIIAIKQPLKTIEILSDDEVDNTYNMDIKSKSIKMRDNLNTVLAVGKTGNVTDTITHYKNNLKVSIIPDDSPIVVEDYCSVLDPQIIEEIDLTNINVDDVILENKSIIDKYSKLNTLNIIEIDVATTNAVKNTNIQEKVTNQLESKVNQNIAIKTANSNQQPSNIDKIDLDLDWNSMKQFFDNLQNVLLTNDQVNNSTNSLSSHETILSECILNSSGNNHQSANNVTQSVDSPSKPYKPSLGTCPICLDDLSKETVGSTNCGHLFCMPCLSLALKKKPKKCPTCRKKLTGTGYHQIYM